MQLNQRRNLNQVEQLVSVEKKDGDQAIREGSGDLSVIDRERRQEQGPHADPCGYRAGASPAGRGAPPSCVAG